MREKEKNKQDWEIKWQKYAHWPIEESTHGTDGLTYRLKDRRSAQDIYALIFVITLLLLHLEASLRAFLVKKNIIARKTPKRRQKRIERKGLK